MSYLKLPNGLPDFSQAVFSLWFRVPKESVIAASDHSLPTNDANFLYMQGVLPLLTYGKAQTNKNYQQVIDENIIKMPAPEHIDLVLAQPIAWEAHTPYQVDPCMIGLKCYANGTFGMVFNIQMGNKGAYQSLMWFATSLAYVEGLTGGAIPGSGVIGTGTGGYLTTIVDGSYGIQDEQNEFFLVETEVSLEPDSWHHVLLSFDVDGRLSIGDKPVSACKLWYAIDDVNYKGWSNLGPFRNSGDGLGDNTIVTSHIYRWSGPFPKEQPLILNNYVPFPNGNYTPEPIPSNEAELGLPAASTYVEAIFRAEMAELQIWTGVTLDTANETARRAFVDGDGKPVQPVAKDEELPPAEELLGKKPEIMLHGSGNWQNGRNTGTLGEIEQFTPVAGIEKFKPEPALGA